MCWNKEVSLNTFLFSMGVLGLIWYNNTYTQYKTVFFYTPWMYVFFLSFIFIQLIEFFLWSYIDRPWYNSFFSHLGCLILLFQPVATTMLISNQKVKQLILSVYLLLIIPFASYQFMTTKVYGTVSRGGHLHWDFWKKSAPLEHCVFLVWLFFFLFPLFYIKQYIAGLFGVITLMVIIYNYFADGTVDSMWCWIVNSIMIYFAANVLIVLPFLQG